MTTKLPVFRKGTPRCTHALKWVALLEVCVRAAHPDNRMSRGYDLQVWIKRRLVRDYGFDHNFFWEQIESPKFASAYNSEVRGLIQGWNKYVERLETES